VGSQNLHCGQARSTGDQRDFLASPPWREVGGGGVHVAWQVFSGNLVSSDTDGGVINIHALNIPCQTLW
jgi:hypothetical protein